METKEIESVTAEILAEAARDCGVKDIVFYTEGTPKRRMIGGLAERPCGDAIDRLVMPLEDIGGAREFVSAISTVYRDGISSPLGVGAIRTAQEIIGFDPTGYIIGQLAGHHLRDADGLGVNEVITDKFYELFGVLWLGLVTRQITDENDRMFVKTKVTTALHGRISSTGDGDDVLSIDSWGVAAGGVIADIVYARMEKMPDTLNPAERRMKARQAARALGVLTFMSDSDIDRIAGTSSLEKESPLSVLPFNGKNLPRDVRKIDAEVVDIVAATDHMLRQIIEIEPTTMASINPPGKRGASMAQDFPLLALPITWKTPSDACVFPSLALSSFFNDISNTAAAFLGEVSKTAQKELTAGADVSITVERCASTLFIASAAKKKGLPPPPKPSSAEGGRVRRWFTAVVNLSDEPIHLVIQKGKGETQKRRLTAGQMYATERPVNWEIVQTENRDAAEARKTAKIVYMCVTIAISLSTGSEPTDAFGVAMERARLTPAEASHIFHTAVDTIDGNNTVAFKSNAKKSRALYDTEDALVDGAGGLNLHAMQMMQRGDILFNHSEKYAILKPAKPSGRKEEPKLEGLVVDKKRNRENDAHAKIRQDLSAAMDVRLDRDEDALGPSPIILVYPKYMPSPAEYVDILPDAERFRHLARSDKK